jgi:DNA-binding transcriptional LysR family regulator
VERQGLRRPGMTSNILFPLYPFAQDIVMDSRRLNAFVAVAEELHFGRAAQRLHMTQPPLSILIRGLEADLGVKLLRRSSRLVELTEPGRVLLDEARQILDRLDQAERRTIQAGAGIRGELSIGFITPSIYSFLPTRLQAFRKQFPDVRLTLHESMSDVQLRDIFARKLHVGFVAAPVSDERLAQQVVAREPLVAALPARHALAARKGTLPVARLQDQPFILFPRGSAPGLFDQILGFCQSAGFSPRIEQEAVQSQTIVGLVSAGLGVAVVPQSIGTLRRPGVTYAHFRERSPEVKTLMVWRKDDVSPALHNFVGLIGKN